MLAIQNLLKNVYCCIRNISKRAHRNCAVLVSGFSVFAMVSLNANGFCGAGKNKAVVECSTMKNTEELPSEDVGLKQKRGSREAEKQEKSKDPKQQQGTGQEKLPENTFAVSCRQVIHTGQNKLKEAEKAQIEKREVAAVCASIEPVQNEVQKPPANPYGGIAISEEDYDALLRIVQAEAGGEDVQGRILVAEVILNRVLAEEFASTVRDVIFEKSGGSAQFAPTADGRYYSVEVTQSTVEAVEKAIHDEDLSQGALFFSARRKANPYDMAWFDNNLTWLFQYGGHEFYTLP